MQLKQRILAICAVLYFVSQILFLVNIQFPRTLNFDEFHYVPSAKQFLELRENQNWEHPPLGKLLMAAGIAVGGDRPFGWRVMSTVFGSLTLVGMFLWAMAVFRDERTALWVALLTFANQMLYVQARIGMLDTFMVTFIVWALAAFCATWAPGRSLKRTRQYLYATGVGLGLATACKWFGIIPWALCIGLVILIRLFQVWRVRFEEASADDWFRPDLWSEVRLRDWILALGVIPVVAYFLTFIPFFFIQGSHTTLFDLILMQKKMWEGQGRVVSPHPYMSTWLDWAILRRPIWYAFDKEPLDPSKVRGVIFLGNPLIMWGGLLALVACIWGWVRERRQDAFFALAFYGAFYLSWAIIPRKVAFFYYYYPAGLALSLALGYVFHRWFRRGWIGWGFLALCWAMFFYFLPVLAALKIPSAGFTRWMWFHSWI